eukprot:g2080.t1
MGRATSGLLLGGALALLLGSASGQDSCVQVSNVSFVTACPCDTGSELNFQMVGETTVAGNKVNVAVITDSSGSVSDDELDLEKDFAKSAVASFEARNLFVNGGTASYASFATSVSEGGTFDSSAEFNEFVDNDPRESGSSTNIEAGLSKGRELLNADPSATASFLILITDGDWNTGADPQIEADAARAEGTVVYAVGVGVVPEETLLSIGGDPANVFDVSDFTELDSALDEIISTTAGSIPCAATGAVLTVEFNAVVTAASVEGGSVPTSDVGGSVVVFEVPNLEDTPTSFEVVLDTCGETEGTPIVASVSYVDDEGDKTPDLTSIEGAGVVPTCDGTTTPPPAPVTPSPTMPTREIPSPAPSTDFPDSYSYTFEPWYDDDYTDSYDPVAPSPHYPEPPSAMPVPAPTTPGTPPVSTGPVAPTGSSPTAPSPSGTTCSNGVEGVESSDGRACCVAECGSCGGVGCSKFSPDLGADDCCVTEIVDRGEACSVWGAAPCYIDGESPVPSPTGETPTAPTTPSAPTTPGTAPTVPGAAPVSPVDPTCSNGIYGIESDNGDVCCVAACGACGGVGCSRFSPDLDAHDCCVTEIRDFGKACSETGAAPCYLDDGAIPGPAPTMTSTDAPVHDFSFSFSFSYPYTDDDDERTPAPLTAPTPAPAPVTPGTPVSVTETFTVQVPELDETSVDFGLLVDVSGSYGDDILNLQLLANDLVEGLAVDTADLALGLGSFSDIDGLGSEYTLLKEFGGCSDDACFDQEKVDFIAAVDTLSAAGGGDLPESQTIALVRAAEDWSWRDGVLKVLAITTDAPFHVPDPATGTGDEYFTLEEVVEACNANSIKILALKAPGSGTEMDTIADGTGGVVATTASDSEDIVSAILQGLEGVQYSKVEVEWVCADSSWTVTVDPSSGYDDVDGGAMLDFTVTVSVPAGAAAGTTCAANVVADEVLVGGQEFTSMADGTVTVSPVTT